MSFFKILPFAKELAFRILILLKFRDRINNFDSNSLKFKKLRQDILSNKKKTLENLKNLEIHFYFFIYKKQLAQQ